MHLEMLQAMVRLDYVNSGHDYYSLNSTHMGHGGGGPDVEGGVQSYLRKSVCTRLSWL